MSAASLRAVRCGFLPLMDAAIPIVAREKGFDAGEGVELNLVRETSWANVRDRMAIGHFDVAHMLAPMPVAAALGLTPLPARLWAPMALGAGGNTIAVSNTLWDELAATGFVLDGEPAGAGAALHAVLESRRRGGRAAATFAVVHPYSGHNYELRYWLAASGIEPDVDVAVAVLPPPFMPDALRSGQIDGCCVGEPWNSAAVALGAARMLTTKAAIWRSSPEKVLGVRADWAERNEETLLALLRALFRAALWCDDVANRAELALLLAAPRYLGVDRDVVAAGLAGRLALGRAVERELDDFHAFAAKAATFPWISHALWFYAQMARWGQVALSASGAEAAGASYRPDLYRRALAPLGAALPTSDAKVEGALAEETASAGTTAAVALGPDGFFDRRVFDPERLEAYVRSSPFSRVS